MLVFMPNSQATISAKDKNTTTRQNTISQISMAQIKSCHFIKRIVSKEEYNLIF